VGDARALERAERVTGLKLQSAELRDVGALTGIESSRSAGWTPAAESRRWSTSASPPNSVYAERPMPWLRRHSNKEAVALSGRRFSGHTEYIAELCGATESRMLLSSERFSTVHVTTHVALRQACDLDIPRIVRTIELGNEAMKLLGFGRPRIAVCG